MSETPYHEPGRRTPAKGVHLPMDGRNWFFLTVCTNKREQWLAQSPVQHALHDIWKNSAMAWLVSDYLLMPDHLHLFCAPYDLKFTIERWIGFWKDRLTKSLLVGQSCDSAQTEEQMGGGATPPYQIKMGKFQSGGFHHRLRDGESYIQKWQYVRENPVRAGLVANAEDWPYQGRVHEIHW